MLKRKNRGKDPTLFRDKECTLLRKKFTETSGKNIKKNTVLLRESFVYIPSAETAVGRRVNKYLDYGGCWCNACSLVKPCKSLKIYKVS